MNLWSYWEGPKPEYIDVCLRSVERVCDEGGIGFRLVTPETLGDYIGDSLHPNYREIPELAMKAGAIRAALMACHGGFWWDADTVGLVHPGNLIQAHPGASALYTTWDRPPLRVLNGYLYMRPGCAEAAQWLNAVNQRLVTQRTNPVVWAELGEGILTPLLTKSSTARRVDRSVFLPVDIDSHVAKFFEPGHPADFIRDSVCFGLNHSWFWHRKQKEMKVPKEKWDESLLLIHQLLAFALKQLEK